MNQHKCIYPLKHFRDFIERGTREDGRDFDKYRPLALSVGLFANAQGSSAVKLGNSSVVCGITAGFTKPSVANPTHGYILPRIDMSFISQTVKTKLSVNNELPDTLSSMLWNVLADSECIKLQDLCIVPEKLVWVLNIDITCVDLDGGIFDATVLASIAALKNLKLPVVKYDVELDKKEISATKLQLNVNARPVISTFALFEDQVLTDPTNEEEFMSNAVLHLSNVEGSLGLVHKRGGRPMTMKAIQKCMNIAKTRENEILELLENVTTS